jgi:hypothetical protein
LLLKDFITEFRLITCYTKQQHLPCHRGAATKVLDLRRSFWSIAPTAVSPPDNRAVDMLLKRVLPYAD